MIHNIRGEEADCVLEFGEHDDHSRCAETIEGMMYDASDAADAEDYWIDAYNRELQEESLGRPLFPNEY